MAEKKVLNARSPDDVRKEYDNWAETYDSDLQDVYEGAKELAAFLDKILIDKGARILDLGAGTGFLGVALARLGYKNLEAHDGSEKMLELAKEKMVYKNHVCELLYPGQPCSKLGKAQYDCVVGAGIISPGHLNPDHLNIIVGLLKKGGKFFLAMGEQWLSYETLKAEYPDWKYNVGQAMEDMEQRKIWRLVSQKSVQHYFRGKPGVLFCYEKL